MNSKKKIIILVSIALVVLIGAIVADRILGKTYFNEIKYEEVIDKIQKKESFVLLISQTTCSHCANYKPKLERVANEYKVNIYYIDVDLLTKEQYDSLNSRISFSNDGTPVTLFLKNGEEKTAANRIKGDVSTDKIKRKLRSNGFIK